MAPVALPGICARCLSICSNVKALGQIWSVGPICLATRRLPRFKLFITCLRSGSLCRGDVNDVIYDAEGAREGRYWCTREPLLVHVRADVGSRERAVWGFESRAVSARVTKHFTTILVKHVTNG